jgi:4-hydroxy-tetrahydrodipicolinate synthase
MKADRLSGVVPPVATPLTPDLEIDVPSLERLLDHLLSARVSGIFVLGSTGEASALTDAQRRVVIETAVRHIGGAVPVLAGVIDMSTARVAGHIKDAVKLGADAVVATAPFYASTHPAEIEKHFQLLSAASEVPIYAYNIPSRVNGARLPADAMVRLAAGGHVAGVKDSSGSDAGIRGLLLAARAAGLTDFCVMTGSELTVDSALAMGASGVVPGLGNVDPHGYVRLYDLCRGGDLDAARREQERLYELFSLIEAGSTARMGGTSAALGAFKVALKLRGVIDCAVTAPPGIPLDVAETEVVRQCLVRAGLVGT